MISETRRRPVAAAFTLAGIVGLAAGALWSPARFVGIGIAIICFFIAATLLAKARGMAAPLAVLVRRTVNVAIWGSPLSEANDSGFEVVSVRSLSAALLVHMRPISGGRTALLKIAQPDGFADHGGSMEVTNARYVSWAGKKLTPAPGIPAVIFRPVTA